MKLYNTLTRQLEEVKPLNAKEIKLYTCGLTVYSQPHIGNWVAYIYWDVLQRVLQAEGYKVKRVQNITDVGHLTSDEDAGEDKMLASALKEGKTAWEVADKYIEVANQEAYQKLELIRPEFLPRATDYIVQQIAFVQKLDDKGFLYQAADGMYFDTSKLDDYGKLAKLDIDGLKFGARVKNTGKKNPTDFAVWKFSPEDQKRDMEWESPWGKGFPGWHLECSVLASEFLGDQIDIHTGGIEHIPVHHTNEIAQTESVTGKIPFSSIWVHANHIKVNDTKMSKSLGNVYTLQDILDKGYSLDAFKLLVLSKHYRTEGNFTWEILDAAQSRLNNWGAAFDTRWQIPQSDSVDKQAQNKLTDYNQHIRDLLSTDLNTPNVLATIDYIVRLIENRGLSSDLIPMIEDTISIIKNLLNIKISEFDITDKQKSIIAAREQARKSEDWAKSDELRNDLFNSGIVVRDTPHGTIWSRV